MRRRLGVSIIFCILLLVFAGCQSAPIDRAVTSKSDGFFEKALERSAGEKSENETLEVHTDSFSNKEGTIDYTMNVEIPKTEIALPVIQVSPHSISSEEAERIANVLFGEENIYEYSTEMSKVEIEETILRLKQHISDRELLVEYYGGDEVLAEEIIRYYEARIAAYEKAYQSAADVVEPRICDWKFHNSSYYDDRVGIDTTTEEYASYDATMHIRATATVDGMPYQYWVSNRDEDDYRIHDVYAYIDDLLVPEAEKYSTVEPTDEDINEAIAMAEDLIEEMQIGEWIIDSCEVRAWPASSNGTMLYCIAMSASPVYNGVKVTHQEQLSNLKSEDAYASNYYYEIVEVSISGGRITRFVYNSPLDVVSCVNGDVETLSFEDIVERLKTQMSFSELNKAENPGVERKEVLVERVELGLTRTRIKNNDEDFYLVPSYTFYGLTTLFSHSGRALEFYGYNGEKIEEEEVLAVINAVDGSIINTQLGY